MNTALTFVLPWAANVVSMLIACFLIVQLSRPDDDWKGWDDPSVPYKRPRWGVQPKPLLKLIVLAVVTFHLIDWMKNDTASLASAWLRGDPVDHRTYWTAIASYDWTTILICVAAGAGLSWYIGAVWRDGQKIGEQRERRRWRAIEGAEKWALHFDELGNEVTAAEWRGAAARMRKEVEGDARR